MKNRFPPTQKPPLAPRPSVALTLLLTPAAWLGAATPAWAQFDLAQVPPLSASQDPAPNVILSIDDSGSMKDPVGTAGNDPRKIDSLKSALRAQFGDGSSKGKIPDGSIRLAWESMWDNGKNSRPSAMRNDQSTLVGGATNSLKSFKGAHRMAFEAFVASLTPGGKTPSHKMMTSVRNYMSGASGKDSPFAADPGVSEGSLLSCRRTYHVFLTDGLWNEESATGAGFIGNYDGGDLATNSTALPTPWSHSSGTHNALPDGTVYDPSSNQTRVYADAFGSLTGNSATQNKGTLADWALANWATDFAPAIANSVDPQMRVSADVVITSGAASTTLAPYWNPRNNPMTWQGVVQHTIGFGTDATTWPGSPIWDNATDDNYGGDYPKLVNGLAGWQDVMTSGSTIRTSELWHMALNGRGKFYPARDATALDAAFGEILTSILFENVKPLTGITANTSNLRTDSFSYVAGFDSAHWSGSLKAYTLSNSGALSSNATWSAGAMLDALSDTAINARNIVSYQGSSAIDFTEQGLGDSTLTALGGGDLANGKRRLAYLRGSRAGENTGAMRVRDSRLGDIVNSQPWYMRGKPNSGWGYLGGYTAFTKANAARSSVVFIGANDGMLHGFNADTGSEMLAYVPAGVFPKLGAYTQPTYHHQYLVDGQPFTADANFGTALSPAWKSIVVGGLGNGGKGFFILDVSSPSRFSASSVMADHTASADNNLGHLHQFPVKNVASGISEQVVRTNDGAWSLVLGNGVNSTDARPVLLVKKLTTAGLTVGLTKVVAGGTTADDQGNGNGLSAPRLIDMDGNGTMDIAYAGDTKGNLWRFDLSSASPLAWTAKKIYTAVDADGKPQPITAAPTWRVHPKGGLMLLVGTGKNFETTDPNNTDTQTIYGIWDVSARFQSAGTLQSPVTFSGRQHLVKQEHLATTTALGQTYYTLSANDVTYVSALDPTTHVLKAAADSPLGWYLDIPLPGHRVVAHPTTFDRNYMQIQTLLPARTTARTQEESCDPVSRLFNEGLIYVTDIFTGKPAPGTVFGSGAPANTGATLLAGGSTTLVVTQADKVLLISPRLGGAGGECTGEACPDPCVGAACPAGTPPLTRIWPNRIPSASYTEY